MRWLRVASRVRTSKPWTHFEVEVAKQPNFVPRYSNTCACYLQNRSVHSVPVSAASESNVGVPAGESNVGAPAGSEENCSPEVQKIHHELIETMKGHCIPKSALISSLLRQCASPSDVKLAFEAIARLRTTRAVQGHQQINFSSNLSQRVVEACLRAQDPENALKTIWTHNIYGFTPSLEAAHQILAYARDHRNVPLMKKTLQTMVANSLPPTRTTADIALRLCKEQGNESLLFRLAKEFHTNGVQFRPALYDVCISTAANAGVANHVFEIEQWRSDFKVPLTTASAFALSKAHLLRRKPKTAARLIHNRIQESEEKDMYLRVLVRAWPVELSKQKTSVNEENLRADMEVMLENLKALGSNVAVDASKEFGTGKETLRKVVYSCTFPHVGTDNLHP